MYSVCFSLYRIIVSKVTTRNMKRSLIPGMFGCNSSQLYTYSTSVSLSLPCYIAAEIHGSEVAEDGKTVNLGDKSTSGGYYNAPLDISTDYQVVVAAVANVEVCYYFVLRFCCLLALCCFGRCSKHRPVLSFGFERKRFYC